MRNFKKSVKAITISIIMLMAVSPVFSQSLTLTPKDTQLVSQKDSKNADDDITTKTYRFHSQSSKEEISDFYKQMFSNEGFKESSQSNNKSMLVFTKASSIILLNFVPDYNDKSAVYYNIQVQEFPVSVPQGDVSPMGKVYSPQKSKTLGPNEQQDE